MAKRDGEHRTGEKIALAALASLFVWQAHHTKSRSKFNLRPPGETVRPDKSAADQAEDAHPEAGNGLAEAFFEEIANLETRIPERGVRSSFWIALIFLLGIGGYYALSGQASQTLDYCAYAFPFCAALSGGLATFHEEFKSVLYVLALIFLSLGVEAYMAGHAHNVLVVAVTNAALFLVLITVLASQMAIAISTTSKVRGSKKSVEIVLHVLALLTCVVAASFSAFFYVFNSNCVGSNVKLSECHYTFGDAWSAFFYPVGQLIRKVLNAL